MNFRERGVYRLPNGRTLIAVGNLLVASCESEPQAFEINETGRLVRDGHLTAWDVSDIYDTGATAEEE